MMHATTQNLSAPERWRMIWELRAIKDFVASSLTQRRRAKEFAATKNPRHIIVFPGLGTDDRITTRFRAFLKALGHHPEGWGLGKNLAGVDIRHKLEDISPRWRTEDPLTYNREGSVPMLCDAARSRVEARHKELETPITLIGWSLGGYVAREVARDLPHAVERLITIGAPVIGGAKYTAVAGFFSRRGMDLDWIEREIARRDRFPLSAPTTAIVSETDAFINYQAGKDLINSTVDHIDVDCAHMGMCFNRQVWRHVAHALE